MIGDPRTIDCPRCAKPLEQYGRPSATGAFVVADMCVGCGGVWLDGAEVGKVYPAFERLATMDPERDPQARFVSCPRCRELATAFKFFEVILDHCSACRGLWIDGSELADLARHRDREDGLGAARAPETYRDNASRALRQAVVVCKRCKKDVALEAVVSTHEGPLCPPCGKELELETVDADLATYEVPKVGVATAVLKGIGDMFNDVLNALDTEPRCAQCGSRATSRCSCATTV